MPRIAFPFVGDTVGGSHRSAAALMRELGGMGFEPIALLHHSGPLAEYLRNNGLNFEYINLPHLDHQDGGVAGLCKLVAVAVRLAVFLRTNRFSLVHANDGRMITSWMPAARIAGIPSIAHRRTRWSRSRIAYLGLCCADTVIAISKFVRESLPPSLRGKALTVVNPVEVPDVSYEGARSTVEVLAGGKGAVIAFVGTLQHQKRPGIFLRAAARIVRDRADARFLMIGRDTNLRHDLLAEAAKLGLSERLILTGYRSDVLELLRGCDLLLAPAVEEGHGRALIEAMLSGVPVVATDSGGHKEIISHGETGFLTPVDDAEALAAMAIDVLTHQRAPIVARARNWAQGVFSPIAHSRRIKDVYRNLGVVVGEKSCAA